MEKFIVSNLLKSRILYLLLLNLFIPEVVTSQNVPYELHAKYWNYRTRLRNDFLLVGPNQGMSIPMQQRGYLYYPTAPGETAPNYSFDSDPNSYGAKVKWGDAMGDIGYYIGVLATEYELLKSNNQNTDSTLRELFYAMYAFNRIDINGDQIFWNCIYFGNPAPTEPLTNTVSQTYLNGFAVRDDVPKTFLADNYEHFNYYGNKGYCSNVKINNMYFPQEDTYMSSWSSTDYHKSKGTNFLSQDNYFNVLVGLTLVRKFVADNVQYYKDGVVQSFQDGHTSIGYEAYTIAQRVIDYYAETNFLLKYPDGTDISNPNGGDGQGYSFGHYEAFCKMRDKSWNYYNPTVSTGNAAFYDDCAYYDYTHVNTGHPILDGMTNLYRSTVGTGLRYAAYVGSSKALCSANDRNEWYWEFVVNSFSNTNDKAVMTSNLMGIGANRYAFLGNSTGTRLNDKVYSIGDQNYSRNIYHAQLLRTVLFGYEECWVNSKNPHPSSNLMNETYNMLQTAPCMGTYGYPSGLGPTIDVEWHTTSRLDWPDRRHKDNLGGFPGEYNGLDYMLYHNLYFLTRRINNNDVFNKVVDFSNRNITVNYPLSSPNTNSTNPWGSDNNPATIGAYEYITSTSTMNTNADVTMIAGKQIDLKPGFTALNGSNITVQIDRLDCNSIFNQNNQYMYVNGRTNASVNDSLYEYFVSSPTDYYEYTEDNSNIVNASSNVPIKSGVIQKDKNELLATLQNEDIRLFPNPADDKFFITVSDPKQFTQIEISNQLGQKIRIFKDLEIQISLELNIDGYSKGIYIVHFTCKNGKSICKKLVKQ